MKSYDITPSLLGNPDTLSCHNLRHDPRGGLSAVGNPAAIADGMPQQILAAHTLPDGRDLVLLHSGTALFMLADDELSLLANLGAAPRCATFDACKAVVMTADGATQIDFSTTPPTIHSAATAYPPLHMHAAAQGWTATTAPAFAFASPYTRWSGALGAKDAVTLRASLLTAYIQAAADAAESSRWLQPTVFIYRLVARDGSILHTGPATLLAPDGGWQGADATAYPAVTDGDGNYSGLQAASLRLRSFALAVSIPAALCPEVAKAEIYASPRLHPFDATASCENRMEGSGTSATLAAHLPGATSALAFREGRFTAMLHALAARIDDCGLPIATINNPFDGNARTLEIAVDTATYTFRDPMADNTEAKGILAKSCTASTLTPAQQLNLPARFSAACACRSGSNVLWGNLRRFLFPGHCASALTVGSPDPAITRASARVTLQTADGRTRRCVVNSAGTPMAPYLNPLAGYPTAEATLLELRLCRSDGTMLQAELPLQPDGAGRRSVAATAAVTPTAIAPASGPFTPFEGEEMPTADLPGMAAAASAADPLVALAATGCIDSAISHITPAWGAGSSWDFANGRFYIFSPLGVHALSLGTDGRSMKCASLDPRPAMPGRCAATTHTGVVAAIGSDIVLLGGTRAQTLIPDAGNILRLAYNASRREVWASRPTDILTVVLDQPGASYTRPGTALRQTLAAGATALLLQGGKLLSAASEDASDMVEICWRASLAIPGARTAAILADICGHAADLELSVADSHGRPLASLRLQGEIGRPAALRLLPMRRLDLMVELRGSVAPGFRIRALKLIPKI